MHVYFLGSGDAFAANQGNNSAYFEFDGTNLFVDFPATNRTALLHIGKDVDFVENLFISHLHGDHTNGIEQLAYLNRFVFKKKTNLYIHKALVEPFWEMFRQGLGKVSKNYECQHNELSDYFNVVIVEEAFEIASQTFTLVQTSHVPEMLTFGLLAKPYFYFSCDSNLDEAFILSVANEVETIYHDCHLWDLPIEPHTSLLDIKRLPEAVQEKIVLMHYHDGYTDPRVREEFARKETIRLAEAVYYSTPKVGVYPGSFDPITNGHLDVIERAAKLFDHVVVVVSKNENKNYWFTDAERQALICASVAHLPNVQVDISDELIVHYMQKNHYYTIIKGLRAVSDFDYEMQMAAHNHDMDHLIDTVFLPSDPKHTFLSSSAVRTRIRGGDDVRHLVPAIVYEKLLKKTAR